MLDIGGGTGNYALARSGTGHEVMLVDASATMLAEASAKGLAVVSCDATALPAPGHAFNVAIMISMLHQIEDWPQALAEAKRVLRVGGTLVVMMLTAEHVQEVTWAFDLFPSMRDFANERRPSPSALLAELPGAQVNPLWFTDLDDASIGALCAYPKSILDENLRRQTSFFERLERDNPAELAEGLTALGSILDKGESPLDSRRQARQRLEDASMMVWHKPFGGA